MSCPPETILFIFIDGIGIGGGDADSNPFACYDSRFFSALGGGDFSQPGFFIPTDAHLGVEGLPQSGTGQTALFTGYNGARIMGRHVAGFPPFTLRPYLKDLSLIKRFVDAGLKASLINAYSPRYFEWISRARGERFMSASTLMQVGSGQRLLTLEDLRAGKSVYMDITHWFLRESGVEIDSITPFEAGRRMVEIARHYQLIVYEYFFPDRVGHEGSMSDAEKILRHMDGLLEGVWDELNPEKELVIISSDHGNFEDLSQGAHTENLVPTFLHGAQSEPLSETIRSLVDIPRAILSLYGMQMPQAE